MFKKPITQLTEADLQTLVDNSEKESLILEYKRELTGSDQEKRELSKDISAMANTDGGYLIIGLEEADGKASVLVGTPKLIGRQPTEEWLESVLISNVRPRVAIKPKIIEKTSDSGRVYIVVHIPQSARRPHMVVADGKNAYYKRYNYQSNFADEHEVRSMFLEAKSSGDEMRSFLASRHMTDSLDSEFAVTSPIAKELKLSWREIRELPVDFNGLPHIVFCACPRYLEERVDIASDDFREWLSETRTIDILGLGIDFLEHSYDIASDSVQSRTECPTKGQSVLYRYVEIFRNGYVEHGTAQEMIWDAGPHGVLLQLTYFTAALWMFIKFARALYEKIGYFDELSFLVALADVENIRLQGFGRKNATTSWPEPGMPRGFDAERKKSRQRTIRIEKSAMASELTDDKIEALVKEIARRLSNAFGEPVAKCFDDDGNFNRNGLGGFRNVICR